VRLFFALWPPPATRDALAAWAERHAPRGARPVAPVNLHLTLAFLGTLPEERMAAIHEAGAAVSHAPVAVSLARIEHWAGPRLLCAVPGPGPDPVAGLAAALRSELDAHRLPVETRPYRGHVTLVRKVRGPLPAKPLTPPLAWSGDRLALVVSESTRDGVRYRELAGWPLREAR
jgi:2'-5' RNA ligase